MVYTATSYTSGHFICLMYMLQTFPIRAWALSNVMEKWVVQKRTLEFLAPNFHCIVTFTYLWAFIDFYTIVKTDL